MAGVRLILALHDHQPVGNFDSVFEASYRESYLPFLDVMEDYPGIPFVLHTSGPLLEWLVEHRPEYIARVRAMAESGRVEVLGGAFFEPILTMIPHRDRVGQIREFDAYIQDVLGVKPRGAWIAERVWEQHLVSALVESGVEYTVLDDFHFSRAGIDECKMRGYFLTEEEGRLLKVFPISERLRYLIPFQEPHITYEYLKEIAANQPNSVMVFADDGEKFGAWPETYDHVYRNGWLRRFCDMIEGNRDWIEPTTFSRAVDSTLPMGKVYLPDSSYREMTEWVLPSDRLVAFQEAVRSNADHHSADRLRPFVRAGGNWRNFKAKYTESDEMYARMLGISDRLATLTSSNSADPDYLEIARQELYRAQCNCSYWHGAFGGLYLPHLRNAVYRHLIGAHNALDESEGRRGPRVSIDAGDYNLDARQEIRLENDRVIAFVRPAFGGHLYELDLRQPLVNILSTLDRRPEAYHAAIAASSGSGGGEFLGPPSIQEKVVLKQEGLEHLLVYDRQPRKALVDHFLPVEATLLDLKTCRDVERGDFATGTYLSRIHRNAHQVALIMERPGVAYGHSIRIRKTISLEANSGILEAAYVLEELPEDVTIHFAVEINLASMAGRAPDRYYCDNDGRRLGMLDSRLDLSKVEGISMTDEWLDLVVGLRWTEPADLWCFPIETVSQSEGGFEGVYQSSSVVPHWYIKSDETRRWEVRIRLSSDSAKGSEATPDIIANEKWSMIDL
ncbi:alpha-amylase/4-alpha-glucanotransferase domain-containing protein [Tundrisphaera lichenicola]|uniref:alpha-amylase/4-alpha-glucanotransferase domain-containing protein n=1 Tax=Tundrisphaera lichenicola TaxID=2029860 RepID=UPI003EBE89C6